MPSMMRNTVHTAISHQLGQDLVYHRVLRSAWTATV
jgi:hypothetical protein